MLLVMLGSMLGFWCYAYLGIGIDLQHQQGKMLLPPQLKANIAVTNSFAIQLDGKVKVDVPINQTLIVPLAGTYKTGIKLDTPIPIKFDVHYKGTIPIKTVAEINDTTALVMPNLPKFPLHLQVPLEFNLPVDMVIPVNSTLRFAYEGPIMLGFNQHTSTRLNTVVDTQLPLNHMMQVPLLTSFDVRVYPEAKPLNMMLHTHLQQPISTLQIHHSAK